MRVRIGDYELRPYGSTCWQLWKWAKPAGKAARGEGDADGKVARPLERYPSTLRRGVGMVAERMLMDGADGVTVGEARGRMLSILDAIDEACDRLAEEAGR